METLARATVSMTEAEVFQLERKRSGVLTEADYLRIITGRRPRPSCLRAAASADCSGHCRPDQAEALTRYGLDVGVAFQISDDALDFVADQTRLGKAVGADLREGKRTLPLIAMLGRSSRGRAGARVALLRRSSLSLSEIEEIRLLVVEHAGVSSTRWSAHTSMPGPPSRTLDAFPPSEEREILALIADFVVDRDR